MGEAQKMASSVKAIVVGGGNPVSAQAAKFFAPGMGASDFESTGILTAERAYRRSAFFRRCVNLRADALAGIPFTLRRGDQILYDSDRFQDWPPELLWLSEIEDLLALREAALIMHGAAYWRPLWKRGIRTGIQWVAPQTLTPNYDNRSGALVSYQRRYSIPGGGYEDKTWPKDQVIAFWQKDPFVEGDRPPDSPLGKTGALNGDVLYSMNAFLERYMQLGLMPASIVSLPDSTTEEERSRFTGVWNRFMSGFRNAGRNLVVNADTVSVQKVGDGLSELGNADITREQREEIAALLGIPMSMILSGYGRAATREERESFYTVGVIPSAKRASNEINRYLRDEGEGFHFRFEYKRIDALQRAQLEEAKALQRVAVGPFIMENEAREIIGLRQLSDDELMDLRSVNSKPDLGGAASQEDLDEMIRPEPLSERALKEIENWHRKCLRKGPHTPFEPAAIPQEVYQVICDRLDLGDDVDRAFAAPYVSY